MTSKKERYLNKLINQPIPKSLRAMQLAKDSTFYRIGKKDLNGLFKQARYIGTTFHGVHNNYTRTHGGYWRLKIEQEQYNNRNSTK